MASNINHSTIRGSILNDNWIFLKPVGWPKLKKRINKLHERVTRVVANFESDQLRSITKIKSEEVTSTKNSRNLPGNATIRKEYVKCGKSDCRCKHGPYYYAYWKDGSGKLKKKYIGKYPPIANTNKAMGRASSDTVADS
jgi:hypothetical protein